MKLKKKYTILFMITTAIMAKDYHFKYNTTINMSKDLKIEEIIYPSWLGDNPTEGVSFPIYFSPTYDAGYDGENLYLSHGSALYRYDGISNINKTLMGYNAYNFIILKDKIITNDGSNQIVIRDKNNYSNILEQFNLNKGNSINLNDIGYDGNNLIVTTSYNSQTQVYIMEGLSGTLKKQVNINDPYTGGTLLYDGEYIEIGGNNPYNKLIYLMDKKTYEIVDSRIRPMDYMMNGRIFDGTNYLNMYNINSEGRLYKFMK